jgi:hypothetical protein
MVSHRRDIAPFSTADALIDAMRGDERDGRRILGMG